MDEIKIREYKGLFYLDIRGNRNALDTQDLEALKEKIEIALEKYSQKQMGRDLKENHDPR